MNAYYSGCINICTIRNYCAKSGDFAQLGVAYNNDLGGRGGEYNFEMHNWNTARNIFIRNPLTAAGLIVNSLTTIIPGQFSYVGGKSYPIFYSGTVKINK